MVSDNQDPLSYLQQYISSNLVKKETLDDKYLFPIQ